MYTIETAKGKTHPVAMCGAAEGFLHIHLSEDISLPEAVREFSSPDNTRLIIHHFGEMRAEHAGYTILVSAAKMAGGVRVVLAKEFNR